MGGRVLFRFLLSDLVSIFQLSFSLLKTNPTEMQNTSSFLLPISLSRPSEAETLHWGKIEGGRRVFQGQIFFARPFAGQKTKRRGREKKCRNIRSESDR